MSEDHSHFKFTWGADDFYNWAGSHPWLHKYVCCRDEWDLQQTVAEINRRKAQYYDTALMRHPTGLLFVFTVYGIHLLRYAHRYRAFVR